MILFFNDKGKAICKDVVCCPEMTEQFKHLTFEQVQEWGYCPFCGEIITAGRYKKTLEAKIRKPKVIKIQIDKPEFISIDTIILKAVDFFHVNQSDFISKSRKEPVREIRQIIQYFARKYSRLTLTEIAYKTGKINHATILNSCKIVQNCIDTMPGFNEVVSEFETYLKNQN